MERSIQEEYESECWPETEPPAFISDLFLECRARALRMHEVYPPSDDTFLMVRTICQHSSTLASLSGIGAADLDAPAVICEVGSGSGLISAALLRWVLAGDARQADSVNVLASESEPTDIAGSDVGRAGADTTLPKTSKPLAAFFCTDKNPIAAACTREALASELQRHPVARAARVGASVVVTHFADSLLRIVGGTPAADADSRSADGDAAETRSTVGDAAETLHHRVDLLIMNPPCVGRFVVALCFGRGSPSVLPVVSGAD